MLDNRGSLASARGSLAGVEDSLAVVDLLAQSTTALTPDEIDQRAGIDTATVVKLAETLVHFGLLRPERKKFGLGARAARWGICALQVEQIVAVSNGILTALHRTTGFNVALYLFEPPKVVCIRHIGLIDYEDGPRLGSLYSAHRVAAGRAMLAFQSYEFIASFCEEYADLIANIDFPSDLRSVAKKGYALTCNGAASNVVEVSMPILSPLMEPVGAVSLWRSSDVQIDNLLQGLVTELTRSTRSISNLLGAK